MIIWVFEKSLAFAPAAFPTGSTSNVDKVKLPRAKLLFYLDFFVWFSSTLSFLAAPTPGYVSFPSLRLKGPLDAQNCENNANSRHPRIRVRQGNEHFNRDTCESGAHRWTIFGIRSSKLRPIDFRMELACGRKYQFLGSNHVTTI